MAQVLFTADTTPSLADLDANFTELYALRNLFTVSGSNLGLGGSPSSAKLHVIGGSLRVESTSSQWFSCGSGSTSTSFGAFLQGGTATIVGYIGTDGSGILAGGTGGNFGIRAENELLLMAGGAEAARFNSSGHGLAAVDNVQTWGTASKRWSVMYAGTGTINTSDAREKDGLRSMSPAEIAAASDISKEIGAFRFLSSIQSKGDAARMHIGLTVQRVIEIMQGYGLDPFAYGFICYDEWPERVEPAQYEDHESLLDANGSPMRVMVAPEAVIPAGNRYGFRPEELLFFIARGLEARIAALEAA